MLNSFSVKSRLIALTVIPLTAFIGLAFASAFIMKGTVLDIESNNNDRVIPLKQIKQVSDHYAVNIIDNIHKYNAHIISKTQLLTRLEKSEALARKEWHSYKNTVLTDKERVLITASDEALIKISNKLIQYKHILNSSERLTSDNRRFVTELYETFEPFAKHLDKLTQIQLNASQAFSENALSNYQLEKKILISGSVLLVIVVATMASIIYKSVVTPLESLTDMMNNIAQNTDLSLRAEIKGNDEFAVVTTATNKMLEHFNSLVKNLRDAALFLNEESSMMSKSSTDIATTSVQQEHQTQCIATAITQMSSAINEVALTAANTSNKAVESDQLAAQGLVHVNLNIESINSLNNLITDTQKDINQLSKKSTEINTVVQLIQDVAGQTNLLALNAAIEAARAGETGRGFAVVADEVRQLAHNTHQATEKIGSMITSLQNISEKAVKGMLDASTQAIESVEIANQSAQSIESIVKSVSEITDMNFTISASTEEQTSVAAEISQNINEFSYTVQHVSKNSNKVASAGESLLNLANKLTKEVSTFKV